MTEGTIRWKPDRKSGEVWIYEGELYRGFAFGYGEMVHIYDENERKSPSLILNGMFRDGKPHGIMIITTQHVKHGKYSLQTWIDGDWIGIYGGERFECEYF